MLPSNRRTTSPGEILNEEFLKPLGMTVGELAKRISLPDGQVQGLIDGVECLTADIAKRLGQEFNMSPEFWLNAQRHYEKTLQRRDD